MYWQGTVSSRLTLKERAMHTRFNVSPPCLLSLMDFEIWCIGRVLLVLGSRLKNEVYIRINTCFPAFIFGVYFHCMLYMFVATKMQAVTITIMRCNFRMESTICQIEHNIFHSSNRTNRDSTCQVVNEIFHSSNRTNRPNRQTCKGSLSLMR